MAGFKKKLPMSAALRQGGEGTVPPQKPSSRPLGSSIGGAGEFNLGKPPRGAGATPKGPTALGKGVKMPKMPSMPKVMK